MAALQVASGRVWGWVNPTRTEADFVDFIDWVVSTTQADKNIVFVLDQLNTHKSESLVRLVADYNGDEQDLGQKGKRGILKNMSTRMQYLEGTRPAHPGDQQRRVRLVYTPKHCSWLNVVEGWFSGLQNRVLQLLSCQSTEELADSITEYIEYYNEKWAKTINWMKVNKEDIEELIVKTKRLVTKLSG